jgi:hypothetical protein
MRKVFLMFLILAVVSPCFAKYSGGTGEPNTPYQIANAADLMTLANDANDYNKCFILTADIDLDPNLPGNQTFSTAVISRDINNANSIFDGNAFNGVFDGAGHKILNLTIDANGLGNDYLGLFGDVNSGEIKNLGLENVSITGGDDSDFIGGLVGYSYGSISNCYSTGAVSGYLYVGGLVGISNGSIDNCYSAGTVTGGDDLRSIGGLVGYNQKLPYPGGNISNCYSTGTVSGSSYVGGLVGSNSGGSISYSYFLITSGSDDGNGAPLTDEQMKQQSSFIGWDFNGVWHICESANYPKLKWQILPGDIVCPDGLDFEDLAELCSQWLFEEIPADLAPPGGDGIVNFADFTVFANQWGITNSFNELLDFTGQWLKTGLAKCSADIAPLPNGDGRVDAADFAIVANNWLKGF